MKIYLTIVIPLVVLALVFVGGLFIMPSMEAPQAMLDRKVDEQVEKAQRLLHQYNAAGPKEQRAFEPTTQPSGVDSEKWRAYRDFDENTPFASLRERIQSQQSALQAAARRISEMGGSEAAPAGVPEAEAAYGKVLDELKSSQAVLDKALAIVRDAIGMTEGTGEAEASGRNNPAATRLEAILLHHKADLLRREAALVREKANLDRIRVERLAILSRDIQDQVSAQKMLLTGGTVAVPVTKHAAAAQPAKAPETAAQPKAETTAQSGQDNAPAADKSAKAGSKNWWILGNLADKAAPRLGKKAPAPKPAEQPKPEAAQPKPAESEPAQLAQAETQPAVELGPAEQVPSLPERIAALQKNKGEVQARITQYQADIDKLSKQIADLEARRDAAREEAKQAELKMLAAEQKGAKVTDPEAVQKFVNEYRKLAEVQRKAAREAATIEDGSVRNVKSAADPEDILATPLAAADQAKPMEPERGLVALRSDKTVAEKSLASSKELLAEIDRQIEQLTGNRKGVEQRLAQLQETGKKLAADLQKYAQSAAGQVVRADQLEKEAIDIAKDQGQQAAGKAKAAASAFQQKTAQFIRSENPTDAPDRKLSEMAGDQFTAANVVLLEGDLSYLLARTYVQQASDLKLHEQMLRELASLAVEVKLNPKLNHDQLPEGITAEDIPAGATNADAAAQAAAEDLKKAAEAGKQALEQYSQAATQLKDLWVVHANIAAVHSLMADLPKVEGDNDDHLALARDTYLRAIQGREKRPEYAAYRRIADNLKAAPKPTAQ